MKKLLTILCLVLLVSCSDKPKQEINIPIHRTVEYGGVTFEIGSNKPLTGTTIEYRDGESYKKRVYKKGKIYSYTRFNKKGKVITKGRFKEGKPEWVWTYNTFEYDEKIKTYSMFVDNDKRYDQGKFIFEETIKTNYIRFENGLPISTWNSTDKFNRPENETKLKPLDSKGFFGTYSPNGELKSTGSIYMGEGIGPYKYYYENGQLLKETTYLDGDVHGEYNSYYENGELSLKTYYRRGLREGPSWSYHENGELKITTNFKDGKYDGLKQGFHENGQLRESLNYKNGKVVDGFYETFHENGQVDNQVQIKGQYLVGSMRSYYENGQLESDSNYKRGKLHDLVEHYYENSQLKFRGNYIEGQRDGLFEWFDEEGNITETELYKNGKMVKQ